MQNNPVKELRTALTVKNYAEAVRFYRETLRLKELQSWNESYGSGIILDAGRATLELLSPEMAAYVDQVEAGRRLSGAVRLAMCVDDSVATSKNLLAGGALEIAAPVVTPWKDRNVRIQGARRHASHFVYRSALTRKHSRPAHPAPKLTQSRIPIYL